MGKKRPLPELLNICLVAHRFQILTRRTDPGFLWPIARGLAKQGHKVTVLSTSNPTGRTEINRAGVRAFYLQEGLRPGVGESFQVLARNKFLQLHKEEPFHIVHSLDNTAYRIAKQKRKLELAIAYDVEATQMSQLFSILGMQQDSLQSLIATGLALLYKFLTTYYGGDRQLLATADGVFVTNPQQRILLERYYLYPDLHIYNVPYGIELGDLSTKEKSLELKKTLQLPDRAQVAVTLSDMTQVQELFLLLKSFEKTAIKKPNSYLIIIGNGPAFKDVEFEMLNLALGNRVILTGALAENEIKDYILLGDLFISMSSRTTGFEPSTIEAMAQKKVVIGSEVSPIAHVIEDGQDGFLLRPADTESLSNLMIEIFSGHLPTEVIGEKARQKVVQLFDTEQMIKSILYAYRQILVNTGLYL
ncbi:MAG: glycosyltransferase family 4 protein [Pseudobdellovibrionaceae bacterium]